MEELLLSIPRSQWRKFLSCNSEAKERWLQKHLLSGATQLFSAMVLNQSLSATRWHVKVIVGNQLPDALAECLGMDKMAHNRGVKKFNRLLIREVTNTIRSSSRLVISSADQLFYKGDEPQRRPSASSSVKPRRKGKAGLYVKYCGNNWLSEGIPKLATIPEANEMEEMLEELDQFGPTVQRDTEESSEALHYNSLDIPSPNGSDVGKRPSQEGFQICDPSKSEENGTKDLSLEDEDSKEYVRTVVGLVMGQALKSSDNECDASVFENLSEGISEKVWARVQGKKIHFRIQTLKKYVKKIFLKLCKAIFCTVKQALNLLVTKVRSLEEAILSCFEKQLLKKASFVERCYEFVGGICWKTKSWMGSSDLLDSNSREAEAMEAGDAPVEKVASLPERGEVAQTVSSTSAREPLYNPEATTGEKPPACPGAAGSSEDQCEESPAEIKTALQTLVKGVMDEMIKESSLLFHGKHIEAPCDVLSQQIWNEVGDKDLNLSSGIIAEHREAIFRDILTKWTSKDVILEDSDKPLTNNFKSCVIEHLQRLAETQC